MKKLLLIAVVLISVTSCLINTFSISIPSWAYGDWYAEDMLSSDYVSIGANYINGKIEGIRFSVDSSTPYVSEHRYDDERRYSLLFDSSISNLGRLSISETVDGILVSITYLGKIYSGFFV